MNIWQLRSDVYKCSFNVSVKAGMMTIHISVCVYISTATDKAKQSELVNHLDG